MKYFKYFDNYTMEEVNHRILYNIIVQGDLEAFKKFLNQTDNAENYLKNEELFEIIIKGKRFNFLNYLLDTYEFHSSEPILDAEKVNYNIIETGKLQLAKKMSDRGIFNPHNIEKIEIIGDILKDNLITLDGIEIYSNLKRLKASNCGIEDIFELRELPYLEILILLNNNIDTTNSLRYLKNLKVIDLSGNNINSIEYIIHLKNLKRLELNDNNIKTINGIKNLKGLDVLNLAYNKISSIDEIKYLNNLSYLDINGNSNIKDYSPIQYLQKLKVLKCLSRESGVKHFKIFYKLIYLDTLVVSYTGEYEEDSELKGIENLDNLHRLEIHLVNYDIMIDIVGSDVRELQEKIKE